MTRKTISKEPPKLQNPSEADRIDVLTFGIGHGDCQLIEFSQKGEITFRLLYDGGLDLSPALVAHLQATRAEGKADLDIVVLSHVDADHRKGIEQLLKKTDISIGELWLPCLPAFRRLSWLFGKTVQDAVELAEAIEAQAIARNIPVVYPLEGYVHRAGSESTLQIAVISPARKLMKKLYSASLAELQPLLTYKTLPLEWLIRSSPLPDDENRFPSEVELFDSHTALSPEQFTAESPRLQRNESDDNALRVLEEHKNQLSLASEPEFFGQHQVNNTSLVLVIDVVLDMNHRRRIVLTGDQENWVWIASEHPMGLGADVMKAPHHGSRVFLSDAGDGISDVEQFWLWTRPRIVTVSANGKYSHPHCQFRESIRMIGATLVCPNKRRKEWIFSDTPPLANTSCSTHFGCEVKEQHPVQRISLAAHSESLDAAACLTGNGHRGPSPIVVMQQKLIEPDESFIRWTQTEVRKHAQWLNAQLLTQRKDDLEKLTEVQRVMSPVEKLTLKRVLDKFGGAKRHELEHDPAPVIRYAQSKGLLWADSGYRINTETIINAPLTRKEYLDTLGRITKFDHLLFTSDDEPDARMTILRNRYTFLEHVNTQALRTWSARWAGVPDEDFEVHLKSELFHDLIRVYQFRAVIWLYGRDKRPRVLLHLYKKGNQVLPDFLPKRWAQACLGYENGFEILGSSHFEQLQNAPAVFPPLRYSIREGKFFLCGNDVKDFYEKTSTQDDTGMVSHNFTFSAKDTDFDWFEL